METCVAVVIGAMLIATMAEFYLSIQDLGNLSFEFLQVLIGYLQDDKGLHVETAIAASASIAGVTLLRSCVPAKVLAESPPGSLLLSDQVNERGAELIQGMGTYRQHLGIPWEGGWNEAVPPEH